VLSLEPESITVMKQGTVCKRKLLSVFSMVFPLSFALIITVASGVTKNPFLQ
jgi:hypothetical protein